VPLITRRTFFIRTIPWFLAAALIGLGAGACSLQRLRRAEAQPPALYATEARSDYGMVSTASVEATRAAVEILEQGGNAVDAAVAGAFALGVADPGGSGLGGMTYIVIALADGRSVAIDGTAHAPVSVDLSQLAELKTAETLFGYKMAATPTTLATLALALERYGTYRNRRKRLPAEPELSRVDRSLPRLYPDLELPPFRCSRSRSHHWKSR